MSVNKPRFTDQLSTDLNNIIRGITTKKSEAYISKLVKMFIKRSHGTDLEVKLPENTRCFVVGDVHGNYQSFIYIIQYIMRVMHNYKGGNIVAVFLGDYVDRGRNSLEVITVIMMLKVLYRNSFIFLRGNHESTTINKTGFTEECCKKYSMELYNKIAQVYDYLPISCVIENRYYMAHAGFPIDNTTIGELSQKKLPYKIVENNKFNRDAINILWADPNHDFHSYYSTHMTKNEKRGCSILYGSQLVNSFLSERKVKMIIRGHEFFKQGYDVTPDNKVLTVFSSNNYILEAYLGLGQTPENPSQYMSDASIAFINDSEDEINGVITDIVVIKVQSNLKPIDVYGTGDIISTDSDSPYELIKKINRYIYSSDSPIRSNDMLITDSEYTRIYPINARDKPFDSQMDLEEPAMECPIPPTVNPVVEPLSIPHGASDGIDYTISTNSIANDSSTQMDSAFPSNRLVMKDGQVIAGDAASGVSSGFNKECNINSIDISDSYNDIDRIDINIDNDTGNEIKDDMIGKESNVYNNVGNNVHLTLNDIIYSDGNDDYTRDYTTSFAYDIDDDTYSDLTEDIEKKVQQIMTTSEPLGLSCDFIKDVVRAFMKVSENDDIEVHLPTDTRCFVVGNLYGDYESFIAILRYIAHTMVYYNGTNHEVVAIFTGNYSSFGKQGIDVLVALMMLKIRYKSSFIMLRGNHEIEHMGTKCGLLDQCTERYDKDLFSMICDAYDYLPISCVVNRRYYIINGGACCDINEFINATSGKLPLHIDRESEVYKALCSMPASNSKYINYPIYDDPDSFDGYIFGKGSADRLLSSRKTKQMIRSQHYSDDNVHITPDGVVTTIFSSMNYINNSAEYDYHKRDIDATFLYINDSIASFGETMTDQVIVHIKKGMRLIDVYGAIADRSLSPFDLMRYLDAYMTGDIMQTGTDTVVEDTVTEQDNAIKDESTATGDDMLGDFMRGYVDVTDFVDRYRKL